MNESQALERARKLWGDRAAVRFDRKASRQDTDEYQKALEIHRKKMAYVRRLSRAARCRIEIVETIDPEKLLDRIVKGGESTDKRDAMLMTSAWNKTNARRSLSRVLSKIEALDGKAAALHPEFKRKHPGVHKRCTVGYIGGVAGLNFFHVEGEGDTWEAAFEKADRRRRA